MAPVVKREHTNVNDAADAEWQSLPATQTNAADVETALVTTCRRRLYVLSEWMT